MGHGQIGIIEVAQPELRSSCRRSSTMPWRWSIAFCGELGSGDLAHGIFEGKAQDLDKEVDGVAGQIALWPAV